MTNNAVVNRSNCCFKNNFDAVKFISFEFSYHLLCLNFILPPTNIKLFHSWGSYEPQFDFDKRKIINSIKVWRNYEKYVRNNVIDRVVRKNLYFMLRLVFVAFAERLRTHVTNYLMMIRIARRITIRTMFLFLVY